jgi:hypothetical protein
MNVTNNRSKKRKLETKNYGCHADVRRLMQEMLQYNKNISEWEMAPNKKHKRYLDKEKVLLLNKYIFPAMANLLFFFYYVSRYPELREVFDDDIEELLGIRRDNTKHTYGFIFTALIQSILLIGLNNTAETHVKDFRLRLIQILQESIWAKVDLALHTIFKNPSAQQAVANDFNRVWGWTRMLAEQVEQQAQNEGSKLHRTINFSGIPPLIEDIVELQDLSRSPYH